jgi:sialate O-acetylesterase
MSFKKVVFIILVSLPVVAVAQPPLRLPSIISNHAVLQQSSAVKLWGWASSGWPVKISCSWNPTDTVFTQPGKDCAWSTAVNTPKASGPYRITFISGNQKIVIDDILTGEVWLCSGQSNMEYNFSWPQGILDAGDAVAQSANTSIRFFQPGRAYNNFPQTNCEGEWKVYSPETVAGLSAIGYFFSKKLNEVTKNPVGLIASYWGGTCVQAWMPKSYLDRDPELATLARKEKPVSWAPVEPSVIYNAMLYPLVPYRIAGAIWYQGEANTDNPNDYGKLFAGLIRSWREVFQNDIPFYFVQIAPWSGYKEINGALLREQQAATLALPKTGMVVVGDLVDNVKDIHPRIKKEVGNRLINMALKEQYGVKDLQPYFPRFSNLTITKNKAVVTVTSMGKLTSKGNKINSFQLAGVDKKFYPATAVIDKKGTIVITAKEVSAPVAVRYCFTNDLMPNLFDVNGLPLMPFRTDKW